MLQKHKKEIMEGDVDNLKYIKAIHQATVIEWSTGEVEAIWGECRDRLKKALQ